MGILILSFSVAFADQLTKHMIRTNAQLSAGHSIRIVRDLFDITFVQNTGAAWGMMSGLNNWLVLLSAVMLACLVMFRRHFLADTAAHRIAVGLMIGGIVGNMADRLRLGYVVDFLDFHWRTSHFPAFNIADSAICVGVGLYLLSNFLNPADSMKQGNGAVRVETESDGGNKALPPETHGTRS